MRNEHESLIEQMGLKSGVSAGVGVGAGAGARAGGLSNGRDLLDRTINYPLALGGGSSGFPPVTPLNSTHSYVAPSVFADGSVGEGLETRPDHLGVAISAPAYTVPLQPLQPLQQPLVAASAARPMAAAGNGMSEKGQN